MEIAPTRSRFEDIKPLGLKGHRSLPLKAVRRRSRLLHKCLLSLLDGTPALVMVADTQGKMLYVNETGRRMLGLPVRSGISGRSLADAYPARSYELILEQAIPTALKTGVWRGETTLINNNHVEISVSQVMMAHHLEDTGATLLSSIAWDIREHKMREERLRHEATHDCLTGLPNRALLLDRLTQAIHSAQRHRVLVATMFLDIDDFKQINDDFGHERANSVLREVARRLHWCVRAEDTVARYGGDEFVVILPDMTASTDIARVVKKMHTALSEPFLIGGDTIFLSASVGVAIYPGDGEDVETLLENADSMMYRVKERTKNGHSSSYGCRAMARDPNFSAAFAAA